MLERTTIDRTLANGKINPGVGFCVVMDYEGSINVPFEYAIIIVSHRGNAGSAGTEN